MRHKFIYQFKIISRAHTELHLKPLKKNNLPNFQYFPGSSKRQQQNNSFKKTRLYVIYFHTKRYIYNTSISTPIHTTTRGYSSSSALTNQLINDLTPPKQTKPTRTYYGARTGRTHYPTSSAHVIFILNQHLNAAGVVLLP